MSYFEDLDGWLTAVLLVTEDDENEEQWFLRVKQQIKDKVLESYRNGKMSGTQPAKSVAKEMREPKPKTFWQSRKGKRQ